MKFIKIISLAAAVFLLLPLLFACVQDEAEAGSEAVSEQTEAESSEDSGWVTKETMYYSDKSYDVAGANVIPEGEGIYFFDRSEGLTKS